MLRAMHLHSTPVLHVISQVTWYTIGTSFWAESDQICLLFTSFSLLTRAKQPKAYYTVSTAGHSFVEENKNSNMKHGALTSAARVLDIAASLSTKSEFSVSVKQY